MIMSFSGHLYVCLNLFFIILVGVCGLHDVVTHVTTLCQSPMGSDCNLMRIWERGGWAVTSYWHGFSLTLTSCKCTGSKVTARWLDVNQITNLNLPFESSGLSCGIIMCNLGFAVQLPLFYVMVLVTASENSLWMMVLFIMWLVSLNLHPPTDSTLLGVVCRSMEIHQSYRTIW